MKKIVCDSDDLRNANVDVQTEDGTTKTELYLRALHVNRTSRNFSSSTLLQSTQNYAFPFQFNWIKLGLLTTWTRIDATVTHTISSYNIIHCFSNDPLCALVHFFEMTRTTISMITSIWRPRTGADYESSAVSCTIMHTIKTFRSERNRW